ncbi:MAG: nucleotidyltransferase domain-containing protein [Armatimonadota bacterium]|nr:nucleotidyltransferase domain-containing protein [Armatimonadota bacterium]
MGSAFDELRVYFRGSAEVAAVYLYGRYADDQTHPDSDIEIGIVLPPESSEEDVSAYMERLAHDNPLGPAHGVLMPSALNQHLPQVAHEMIHYGSVLVDNDPVARERFVQMTEERMQAERPRLLEEARELLQQSRSLGEGVPTFRPRSGQPMKMVDPVRVGWRLGRVLTSLAVIEVGTREIEEAVQDAERVNQMIGWFSNAAGAATGIAKAMLTTYDVPRPPRRWQVFLPLADLGLLTMEHALWMAAMVETRWSLMFADTVTAPERVLIHIRTYLPHLLQFARVACWATEMPTLGEAARLH